MSRTLLMVAGILIAMLAAMPAVAQGNRPPRAFTSSWYTTRADLFFANANRTITGQATYRQRLHQGQREQRLQVHVQNAAPLRMIRVHLNGVEIGVIPTDLFGNGLLFMRTNFDGGVWQPMPDGFPTVLAGDVMTVGRAVGTFGAPALEDE
ncbi:MAG: hypothetical protein HRU76_14110 [Phycisphaeraceae bacterium]|nr:hypothetical protein [Phycisphaerales bacterium]QOJ18647.1 MAG: hypothetical protein HRU76_14110 [Phycisphaeraceae bacterium]